MFWTLISVVVGWVYTFVKTHQIVHLKSVHLSYLSYTSIKTKTIGGNLIRALPPVAAPYANEDVVKSLLLYHNGRNF